MDVDKLLKSFTFSYCKIFNSLLGLHMFKRCVATIYSLAILVRIEQSHIN